MSTTHGVVNLSKRPLTLDEISLLQRGLKFCPTPACPEPGEGREDFDALHKRLRLMAFYEENPLEAILRPKPPTIVPLVVKQPSDNAPFKDQKFKLKSTWRGPIGPANLEAFIASNCVDFNKRPHFNGSLKNNLSRKEIVALKNLRGDKSIVIKPADKGSSIVLINRADYLKEGY